MEPRQAFWLLEKELTKLCLSEAAPGALQDWGLGSWHIPTFIFHLSLPSIDEHSSSAPG